MLNWGDIYQGLVLVTGPTIEPVTLTQAEAYLRVNSDSGGPIDQDITGFITAARQKCETALRRGILTQTWRLSLRNWPGRNYVTGSSASELDVYYKYNYIKLPLAAPLQSVGSVNYLNSNGQLLQMTAPTIALGNGQIISPPTESNAYNVYTDPEPGLVMLPYAQIWPTDILMPGAPIFIEYTIGFPDVPTFLSLAEWSGAVIKAINLMISYWYENKIPPLDARRSEVPAGLDFVIQELLNEYVIYD